MKSGRFEVGDTVYIAKWYYKQPSNTVVKAKIVSKFNNSWVKWIKYEIEVEGRKGRFLIGDFNSPDVFTARIYKKTKKEIYKLK